MRALRITIVVLLLASCVGCQSHYYHQRFPILERPPRPSLLNVSSTEIHKMSPTAQAAVTSNFDKLIDYSRKLETAVDTYNKYAREKNSDMGLNEGN